MAKGSETHADGKEFIGNVTVTGDLEVTGDVSSGGLTQVELDFLDGAAVGTVVPSKAVIADASGRVADPDLILKSTNPATIMLGDVDGLQLDNAAIAAFAAAADTTGNPVYIETEDGGVDTAVDGGSSGALLSIKTGDGSAGGADFAGAAGGAVTLTTGDGSAGGAHTSNNPAGGAGGAFALASGAGGAGGSGGSGVAGAGGAMSVTAGAGGASGSGGTGTSGAGGAMSVVGGAAGTAAADTPGGAGGVAGLTAGAGAAGGTHTANNPDGGAGADVDLTVGAGGVSGGGTGVAGRVGKVKVTGGMLDFANAQTIAMADGQLVLTRVPGTPVGTEIVSNLLYVDPDSTGGTEDLLLPPEADCNGLTLMIANTAGGAEDIVVKEDGDSTTICTISQDQIGVVFCDGTSWRGGIMAIT